MLSAMTAPAPQPDAYARAVHRFSTAGKIDAARTILNWDAQTHMPSGGAWARGEEMAALTEVSADLVGSRAAGDELAEAEAMAGALEPPERADLKEMRRLWVHTAAVPKELLDRACLLCSEEEPHHCHRRLVAEYLKDKWSDVDIEHIP